MNDRANMWSNIVSGASVFGGCLVLWMTGCSELSVGGRSIHLAAFDSTFIPARVDFGADGHHPVELPAPELQVGRLLYQASIAAVDTTPTDGPMSIWVRVHIRNRSKERIALRMPGCPMWPLAFRTPSRQGVPAWIPGGVIPGDECVEDSSSVAVMPDAPAELSFLAHNAMLGSGMGDGRYYFTARLRDGASALDLTAGSADIRLQVPGLAYQIQVGQVGRDSLRVEATVTNRNNRTVRLLFGACALGVTLYRDEARTERLPAGESRGLVVTCPDYLREEGVEAGSSLQAAEFLLTRRIDQFGQQVSGGSYYASVTLELNWRALEFPVGRIEVW